MDVCFQLSSDLIAIGPAGSSRWNAINPALAARLGLPEGSTVPAELDPNVLTAVDGSRVGVDWTIQEIDGTAYWIGRERHFNPVRELHHRLKNNLQFVLSLLAFQSARATDAGARTELEKAESRVRAVARLHDSAHASADFSEVEFGSYLRQLVHAMAAGQSAAVHVDASDVALPIEQAVPLAIIAHELVANAFQHSGASTISVLLQYETHRTVCLNVADNGHGMNGTQYKSGLELVALFVDQLQGTQYVQAANGLNVSVTFPIPEE